MSFFNKKEEVLDIQLTRLGRQTLAKGNFSPKYYQFFDDDIVYNTEFAGFSEKQNNAQERILENTPKLKKNANVSSPLEFQPHWWSAGSSGEDVHAPIATRHVYEKSLLYPLANSESNTKKAPHFSLDSHDNKFLTDQYSEEFPFLSFNKNRLQEAQLDSSTQALTFTSFTNLLISEDTVVIFKTSDGSKIAFTFNAAVNLTELSAYPVQVPVTYNEKLSNLLQLSKNSIDTISRAYRVKYQYLTDHGIYKKIPQLNMTSEYTIVKYSGLEGVNTTRDNNSNNFIDLTSETIEFLDKSALHVTGSKIIFSLEEVETHYNLSNFELEIYEIDETPITSTSGEEVGPDLKRLKNINHINSLFHIKTDEHVTQVKTPFGERRNWYRSGE
jgi:hypothetical protein